MRRSAIATVLLIASLLGFASRADAAVIIPQLVRIIETSAWSPPSPDPMGIAFHPSAGRLIVVDSEVEEMAIWQNANLFEASLTGGLQRTADLTGFTNEPVDVAVNPSDGHMFVSDDNARRIYEVNVGGDGKIGTGDDSRTFFSTSAFGSTDPEGLAYGAGSLFVGDGSGSEIYRIQPGNNGLFDGVAPSGDDQVTHFDTAGFGQTDPEGVEYNPDTGTLYICSRGNRIIAEATLGGSLVNTLDLSSTTIKNCSGIAYAPTSNDPSARSIYLAARGVDNDSNPSENDGRIWEFRLGSAPPPTNQPPVVTNPGSQANTEGDAVNLQIQATDPNGDDLTYSATGLPTGLTINPSTGLITGTVATGAAAGSPYTSRVTADDGSLTDTETFTWTITPGGGGSGTVVTVPVAAGSDDAEEFPAGNVDLTSSDIELVDDGSNRQTVGLRFAGVAVPAGATVLEASLQFQVDEATTGATSLTIHGQSADNPPTFTTATGNISSRPRTTAAVPWSPAPWNTVGEAGPDQRTPNLGAVVQEILSRPGWSSGNAIVFVITGSGRRTAEAFQTAPTTLRIEYQTGTPANRAPVVTNPGAQSDTEGDAVSLQIQATDPDGDPLTYSATGLPTGLTINTSTGLITGTVAAGAAAGSPYTSRVTADDGSLTDTETFTWTINPPSPTNGPPVVTNPGSRTNIEGDAVNLQIQATDPNGDPLTYSATGLPTGLTINPVTGLITGTVAAGAAAGSPYTTRVTADDGSLTDTETFTWTITPPPVPTTIQFVGATSSTGTGTTLTLARPAGVAADDLLLAAIAVQGSQAVAPPEGWTVVRENTISSFRQIVFSRRATASEPNSYPFTVTVSGRKNGAAGLLAAYRGVASIETSAGQANASSNTITAPSATASITGSVEVGFFGIAAGGSITPPTGMTERGEASRSVGGALTRATIELSDVSVEAGSLAARTAQATATAINIGQVLVLQPR